MGVVRDRSRVIRASFGSRSGLSRSGVVPGSSGVVQELFGSCSGIVWDAGPQRQLVSHSHLIDAPIGRIDQMVRRPAVGRKNLSPKAKNRIAESEKMKIGKYHDRKVLVNAVTQWSNLPKD